MADADWWATFFGGAAREAWRFAHSREENRAEARAIARLLGLEPGDEVLDVPCGEGRLALELASFGHRVCGLDASAESLKEARAAAERARLEIELACGDMRRLPWHERFAAAFCFGNSFGLFDEAGDRAFFASVAGSLRHGGRFLLECPLVAELVATHRLGRDWRILGEHLLLTESALDERSGRLEALHTFVDLSRPSSREERSASHRVYAVRELEELVRASGFAIEACLGGWDGRPFGAGSEEFLLVAARQ